MLSEEEQIYLLDRISAALAPGNPIALLSAVLPTACMNKISHELAYPDVYAREAIRICRADGWNNVPCWLLGLLDLFPSEPKGDLIRQRLAKPPRFAQPHQARVLVTEAPFLNREPLRTRANSLAANSAPRPILIVNGQGESGKSYTYEYVEHLYFSQKLEFRPLRVEFNSENGRLVGPEELARDILTGMGVGVHRLPSGFFEMDTNAERWPFNLAGEILAEGAGKNQRFWIVLDNFRGPNLRVETAKLIDGLAQRILGSVVYADNFRLVLLNFDRSNLSIQPHRVEHEQISPVSESDIRECVAEIFERYSSPATQQMLAESVAKIMSNLPATGRLKELNSRLIDLIQSLKGPDDA